MRLRTLRIWKKGKPVWISLLVWAAISVVMLVWIGSSLMDYRGNLPKIQPSYTNQMVAKDIKNLYKIGRAHV